MRSTQWGSLLILGLSLLLPCSVLFRKIPTSAREIAPVGLENANLLAELLAKHPIPETPPFHHIRFNEPSSINDSFANDPFGDKPTEVELDPFGFPVQKPVQPSAKPNFLRMEQGELRPSIQIFPSWQFTGREAHSRRALAQSITVVWNEIALGAALHQFGNALGLKIFTDPKGLEEAAVTTDQIVSLELRHVSAGAVLHHFLSPLNLTFYVEDGDIIVTSKELHAEHIITRVYDVADLVSLDFMAVYPRQVGNHNRRRQPVRHDPTLHSDQLDFESLIELITSTITPDSWLDNGGKGTISGFPPNKLVASQTEEIHVNISGLLRTVREVAAGEAVRKYIENDAATNGLIYRKLEQYASLGWPDTTLQEAMQSLSEQLDIPILFDPVGLEEAGVTKNQAINELPFMRAATLLRRSLGPMNLTYTARDGVLIITSKEKAGEQLETCVYNVKDLIARTKQNTNGFGRMHSLHSDHDSNIVFDYYTLIDLLSSNVNPDSWLDNGGKGTISGFCGMLVISQTHEMQADVQYLLDELRRPSNANQIEYRQAINGYEHQSHSQDRVYLNAWNYDYEESKPATEQVDTDPAINHQEQRARNYGGGAF